MEVTPLLANMLSSSRLCGNLHRTTQLLELITRPIHHSAVPQLYNKKPRQTKSLSLNRPSNETCRASLLTDNRKELVQRWQDEMPEPTLEGTDNEEAKREI